MKKLLFLISLLFSANSFAQTIPNAGFESWNQAGPTLVPSDWASTPNVRQSTDAHSGSYSLLLTVDTITNPQTSTIDTIGGMAYTGVQTMGPPPPQGTTYGGFPFTGRPDSIAGWLKYAGQQGDFFYVSVQLSKWNAAAATREIIAVAFNSSDVDIPTFSYGNLAFTYNNNNTPDTAFIQFSVGDQMQRHIGSTLWVDDLVFVYNNTASINPSQSSTILGIFPNPADASFTLKSNTGGLRFTIQDLQGRIVQVGSTNESNTTIPTADLESGMYFLRSEKGDVQKIQVLH